MSSKVLEYDRNDPAWLHEPDYRDYDEIVDMDDMEESTPREGVYFFAEGDDWMWLESIGDEYHMDFDNWQVWRATNGKTEEFFVVEVDTGFIDWGPCSEKEAVEFLESKYQDYLSDEFESDYSDDEIIEIDESYDGSYGNGSIEYPVHMASAEVGMSGDELDIIGTIHADSEDEANELLAKYYPSTRGTKYYLGYPEELTNDEIIEVDELSEDTVKKANGMWTNRGDDGKEHGEFKTKKAADAQRKAMFANGYKAESDECTDEELDDIVDEATNPGAIPSVPGRHKTIDDECVHEPKKIRMFRDLDKKDESKSTGILMAKVGDEVVDSRTGKIGIVKGTTGSRSNETTYIVDFDGKEKRINAMRDAQTTGRYYLRKDESVKVESNNNDALFNEFSAKVKYLSKYCNLVTRNLVDYSNKKELVGTAVKTIYGIVDRMSEIRDQMEE